MRYSVGLMLLMIMLVSCANQKNLRLANFSNDQKALITAFDALEASGAAEPAILAGGIKVALLSPLFGLFTFSGSKLAILILRIIQK